MGAVFSDSGRPGPGFAWKNGNHRTLLYLDSISGRLGQAEYASIHQAITVFIAKTKVSRC